VIAQASDTARVHRLPIQSHPSLPETDMGKYFIGWLLGIPAIILVLLYLIFH
jgi:hypothetical protein